MKNSVISSSVMIAHFLQTGSWEGLIRIWHLDSKLKSFALVGTIPAPGVVNSLQFITPSKEFFSDNLSSWATRTDDAVPVPPEAPQNEKEHSSAETAKRKLKVDPVLMIAGMGQEHRLGRWLSIKGQGAVNGALVVAFHPRTT